MVDESRNMISRLETVMAVENRQLSDWLIEERQLFSKLLKNVTDDFHLNEELSFPSEPSSHLGLDYVSWVLEQVNQKTQNLSNSFNLLFIDDSILPQLKLPFLLITDFPISKEMLLEFFLSNQIEPIEFTAVTLLVYLASRLILGYARNCCLGTRIINCIRTNLLCAPHIRPRFHVKRFQFDGLTFSSLRCLKMKALDEPILIDLRSFRELENLELCGCSIDVIVLSKLTQLRNLTLKRCRLFQSKPLTSIDLGQLEFLQLNCPYLVNETSNRFIYDLIGQTTLKSIKLFNVLTIDEQQSIMRFFPENLVELDLIHIHIREDQADSFFEQLKFNDLKQLKIQNRRPLIRLSKIWFENFQNLVHLDLSQNGIEEIDFLDLDLRMLQNLNLSKNKICSKSINGSNLHQLEVLRLSGNRLDNDCQFDCFQALKYLFLDGNRFTKFYPEKYRVVTLIYLDMRENLGISERFSLPIQSVTQ